MAWRKIFRRRRSLKSFNLTVAQVAAGGSSCRSNAMRLSAAAEVLIDNGRSTGRAYALWSYAVEEYGKALKLEKLTAGKAEGELVPVPVKLFRGEHNEKFKLGFEPIRHLVAINFSSAVIVLRNTTGVATTIRDPRDPKWVISARAHTTGEFQDTSSGVPRASHRASVVLRHVFLYVDWDNEQRTWRQPEPKVRVVGLDGHFTVSSDEVRQAIAALRDELNKAPSAGIP
jgi:AbiV family abortive infection protein